MEVTHDYPDAWHSMDLVAEHRLRMLHTSGAYEKWQAVQKTQPHPSSKLSIKIEQVLEVSLSRICTSFTQQSQSPWVCNPCQSLLCVWQTRPKDINQLVFTTEQFFEVSILAYNMAQWPALLAVATILRQTPCMGLAEHNWA